MNEERQPQGHNRRSFNWPVAFLVTIIGGVLGLALLVTSQYVQYDGWEREMWVSVLREAGIVLIVTALVTLIYEWAVKNLFLKEVERILKQVVDERYEVLHQSFAAGVEGAYQELGDVSLAKRFREAKDIRILQTWISNMSSIDDALLHAVTRNKCHVRILLLNPSSIQGLFRSKSLNRDDINAVPTHIVQDLGELKTLYKYDPHLFVVGEDEKERNEHPRTANADKNENNKYERKEGKIEVRLYDSIPVVSIFGYDDTNVIGMYWQGVKAMASPQLEIVRQRTPEREGLIRFFGFIGRHSQKGATDEPYLAKAINDHFEQLWKKSKLWDPEQWDPEKPDLPLPEVSVEVASNFMDALQELTGEEVGPGDLLESVPTPERELDGESRAWLEDDSLGGSLPRYDWGEEGPPKGKPVRYVPGVGLVVSKEDDDSSR